MQRIASHDTIIPNCTTKSKFHGNKKHPNNVRPQRGPHSPGTPQFQSGTPTSPILTNLHIQSCVFKLSLGRRLRLYLYYTYFSTPSPFNLVRLNSRFLLWKTPPLLFLESRFLWDIIFSWGRPVLTIGVFQVPHTHLFWLWPYAAFRRVLLHLHPSGRFGGSWRTGGCTS